MKKKLKCMECNKEFERDVDTPQYKKALANMGIVAQQCNSCLRKWYWGIK